MAGPWMAGCATGPGVGPARATHLVALVADGTRLADDSEAAAMLRVWRDGQPIRVHAGMALQLGDRFSTSERGQAVVRFSGGTELYVGPASRGRIGTVGEALGSFFAKVRGLFDIETEFVHAGARGTGFRLDADANGRARILVLDGRVEVASPRGAWAPVVVAAGQGAKVHPQAPVARPLTETELRDTVAWVEGLERLVPAAPKESASGVAPLLAVGAMLALLASSGDRADPDDGRRDDGTDRRRKEDDRRRADGVPPLSAPDGLRPGAADLSRAPTLKCGLPVPLTWDAVPGALDYAIRLQLRPPRGTEWRDLDRQVVSAARARTPGKLSGTFRWWVQARDARGAGPTSAAMYFECAGAEPR
ncbi:MAG: FecR domain-containing protein [Burkholderiales bacterium]|nr:FecR domain-containing protein [Burkholderiales bacterium]